MTEGFCITFCQSKGFPFAGVEWASECYCDYSLGSIATKQPDSDCNFGCTGNALEACGAGNRLSVFTTTVTAAAAPVVNPGPANWTALGCFNDNIPGRILGCRYGYGVAMSVLQFTNTCKAAGFTYAGVEYSSECYCDNQILAGASNGQVGCNKLCSGNGSEYCGGSDRINVYRSTIAGVEYGQECWCDSLELGYSLKHYLVYICVYVIINRGKVVYYCINYYKLLFNIFFYFVDGVQLQYFDS
ncbi:hypothetical protein EsH8_VIII_001066 [Colletotrichum jinshuiense]